MGRHITVLPSARRLMESLRDIGYDLPSAVADLVDNSIDANATHIELDICAAGADSWFRITDDGLGMSGRQLDEAMRYGSSSEYGTGALGHFGLGLKTGSLSQCRRLTVASRRSAKSRVAVRRWDLDEVAERDSWDLDSPPRSETRRELWEPLESRSGTVVFWEKLDRVLAFRNPSGGHAKRALDGLAREISAHLGMVFHRFLSGEFSDGQRRLQITVNGEAVQPWDPFARQENRTRALSAQTIELPLEDGTSAMLTVAPFVLPAQTQFSSVDAHQSAAGPNRWNRQQGFYIYRRERLIQSGGWNRLRTLDEHAKLARIAVDLPHGQEELFGINVAKMSVSLPEGVRAPLRAIASATVNEAQRSYREVAPPPAINTDSAPDVGPSTAAPARGDELSLSGDWPLILRTLNDTMSDLPGRRDEVLLKLANAFTA